TRWPGEFARGPFRPLHLRRGCGKLRARSSTSGARERGDSMAIESINPTTGEVVARFTELTDDELEKKLALAERAYQRHRRTSFAERAERLQRLADLLDDRAEEL